MRNVINKIKIINPKIFSITCSYCGREIKRETIFKYTKWHDSDLLDWLCRKLGMFDIYGCKKCFHSKVEFYNALKDEVIK